MLAYSFANGAASSSLARPLSFRLSARPAPVPRTPDPVARASARRTISLTSSISFGVSHVVTPVSSCAQYVFIAPVESAAGAVNFRHRVAASARSIVVIISSGFAYVLRRVSG